FAIGTRMILDRAAAAAAAAGMHASRPMRVLLVRVEPPAQNEERAVLVFLLYCVDRLADPLAELAVLRVSFLVDQLRVGLYTRKAAPALAMVSMSRAIVQLLDSSRRADFRHDHLLC